LFEKHLELLLVNQYLVRPCKRPQAGQAPSAQSLAAASTNAAASNIWVNLFFMFVAWVKNQ
jgi:hypothetical protein